ncbi:MAG: type II toxin-antitoxin system PrlF family antitoxin [Bdellovibrio sp.]
MKNQAATSKISAKNQTTVPTEVRKALQLTSGDGIRWVIEEGKVSVKKMSKIDMEWTKATEMTLQEWNSQEDDEAYNGL